MRGVSRLKYSRTASHINVLPRTSLSQTSLLFALSATGGAHDATNSAIPASIQNALRIFTRQKGEPRRSVLLYPHFPLDFYTARAAETEHIA